MSYESWRISYQSSEQAARAAFDEIATLRVQLAAAEARAERLAKSLKEIIDDLETRSDWKEGTQKGVVDIGQGCICGVKQHLPKGVRAGQTAAMQWPGLWPACERA